MLDRDITEMRVCLSLGREGWMKGGVLRAKSFTKMAKINYNDFRAYLKILKNAGQFFKPIFSLPVLVIAQFSQ